MVEIVVIVVDENCPNCKKIKKALNRNNVPFQEVHRDLEIGTIISNKYRLVGVPITVLEHGSTELAKVGFSRKIVNEITKAYRSTSRK